MFCLNPLRINVQLLFTLLEKVQCIMMLGHAKELLETLWTLIRLRVNQKTNQSFEKTSLKQIKIHFYNKTAIWIP